MLKSMKLTLRGITLVVSTIIASSAFCQEAMPATAVANNDHSKLITVYGQAWINSNPGMVQALEECYNSRIIYEQVELTEGDKYPLLSSFPLFNKFNPKIEPIVYSEFNPQTFNPFIYNIEFLSDRTQIIRVDGTNWVIIIRERKH